MLRRNFFVLLIAGAAIIILISLGCDDLVTQTIKTTIAGNPTAEFTITPDSGCIPLTVAFEDASSGPVRTWIWNFGDSIFDTLELGDSVNGDISHTYTRKGTYTVTLSVFDSLDGSDAETKKRAVIVGHNLDSVKLSDTLACPGNEVTFRAFNPYGITSWRWDFGDGTVLTDSSVIQTHAYAAPGLYPFTLSVTGGCGTLTLTDSVHIVPCPEVAFSMNPSEACAPAWVKFTDMTPSIVDSLGAIISAPIAWSWNFGNGSTSIKRDDSTRYTVAGSIPVTLRVTTDLGAVASYTDTILITPATKAIFTSTPNSDCYVPNRQFVVKFTDESIGATAWLWDFGDGDSSDQQNPAHAYTEIGTYTVKLRAIGPCGTDDTTRTNLIEYSDSLSVTAFKFEVDTANSLLYTFTDTSAASVVVHRLWNFGDGYTSQLASAPHTYTVTVTDTMNVILTRWNKCDSLADTQQVIITIP